MKFTWFNLMPWPYLPDDFREKHRSVWVDIDQRLFDPVKSSHEVYNTYMDLLEYADTLGFDGIGVNEHHQNGYGIMPCPNIIAAGLARRTKNAAIVVLGNSIALYNPPRPRGRGVRHARLHLGRAPGRRLPGRHLDGHQLLLRPDPGADPREIRRGPRPDHQGVDQPRAVRLQRPLQQAALRQHLAPADPAAASADPHPRRRLGRDLRLLHRQHLLLLLPQLLGLPARPGADGRLLAAGGGARRADKSPYRAGFAQTICVADTDEEAERLYWPHVSYFYNRCLHVYPGFADAPGYRTIKTIQTGALSQYAPPRGGYTELTWKDLTEQGHVIAGSPETVRQRLEELIKGLHVGNIFCLMHVGDMPAEKCMYSTKLFAEKVMPKLRNVFPEYASDDRFWCHPISQPAVPGSLGPAPTTAPGAPARAPIPAE